jgi:hypothetical protein
MEGDIPPSDDLPVIKSYSGAWQLDSSRSESLEKLFAAMDVGWLARKLVGSIKIQSHIYHTKEAVILTDHSFLGNFTLSLVPDGKWRCVAGMGGGSGRPLVS